MASLFSDADWDPMRLDFEDANFNKFISGPGKKLYDPNAPQEFKLQVADIPRNCSQQSLINLFSIFGAVEIRAFITDKKHQSRAVAYIVYNDQISANRAIKEVHKEPPFNLKVSYATSRGDNGKRSKGDLFDNRIAELIKQQNQENGETDQPPQDNIYHGPKFDDIVSNIFPPKQTSNFIVDDNFDPMYCNPLVNFYSDEYKIYPAMDKMYSDLYQSSHRLVTMGRGYRREKHWGKVITEKPIKSAKSEPRKSTENGRSGLCELCSKKSFNNCNYCCAFYCSRECQVEDWPQHKLVCQNFDVNKENENDETSGQVITLKVTHVENDCIYAIKMDDVSRFEELRRRLQIESPKQPGIRLHQGTSCAVFDEIKNEWCRGVVVQVSAPVHTIFFSDYGCTKRCMSSQIKLLHFELSKDEAFALKIKLNVAKPDRMSAGAVIQVSSLERKTDFFKAVLKESAKSISKSVCSTVRKSEFFGKTNVKIIELSTEEFTEVCVVGVLTNSTYFVSWNQFIAPKKSELFHGYIKTDEDSIYPVGTTLRVRSICRFSNDFFSVEIESGPDVTHEPILPVSIVNWLKKGDGGKILVTCIQRHSSFLATMIVKKSGNASKLNKWARKLFVTLQEEMSSSEVNVDFLPKIGDLVAVYHERGELWARGVVWSVSGSELARIALIDFGQVVSASLKKIRPLNEKFRDSPSLTVRCNVETFESKSEFDNFLGNPEKDFDFVVVEESPDKAAVCSVLSNGEVICSLEISEWNPTSEEIGLKAVALKTNSEVKLSQFYSTSNLYVIPTSQACFIIEQMLDKYMRSTQPMTRIPRFGELVACKWSKNNEYCRAQVLEPFGKSEYRIFFVDSGTQEIGKLGDIFELNDELKSYPCLAVKVTLKDIDSNAIANPKALNYLNLTGFKDEALKIIIDANNLFAVELKHLSNVSMNERLNHHLQWTEADSNEELYYTDLHSQDLKIGADVELSLLCKLESAYVMIDSKSNAAQYLFNVLQSKMNEYCESLSTKGLYPREGEVVFVQVDTKDVAQKNWYRAVVKNNPRLGCAVVRCLDIGGLGDILHSSIRRMHPKFMVLPAVAHYVFLQLPKELSSIKPSSTDDVSLKPYKSYLCHVISHNDDTYCVEMEFLKNIVNKLKNC